jgi:hypothetical protein
MHTPATPLSDVIILRAVTEQCRTNLLYPHEMRVDAKDSSFFAFSHRVVSLG